MKAFPLVLLSILMVTLVIAAEQSTNSVSSVPISIEGRSTMAWWQWIVLILTNLATCIATILSRRSPSDQLPSADL